MKLADNTIEVVKTVGGTVTQDEVYTLCQCPNCNAEVARGWLHCPYCGDELPYGDLPVFETCRNVGDATVFECSNCGRRYIPVQIRDDGVSVADWNSCPGCRAVVA